MTARGFTLLEALVALGILGVSLLAIFDISSQAVYSHVYAKKLTVATLLARSKMTDLEQELYDKGFSLDDDEQAGDFSDDGWPSYKWRAKIIAPKTQGLSPDVLIGALFNLPMGGGGKDGAPDLSGLGALFGGSAGKAPPGLAGALGGSGGGSGGGILSALGPAAGLAQGQFQQLVDTLTKSVREVHLTVTWKEGKLTESFDLVTHVVSMGPGSDRNGGVAQGAGVAGAPGSAPTGFVRQDNGLPVPNAVAGPNGGMVDPRDNTPVVPADQWANGAAGGRAAPGVPQGLLNNPMLNNPAILGNPMLRGLVPGGVGTIQR
ncbi:MAG: prepilin-type N-terminal cleavage/methylation domain-containing protein [Myxococcaceae bacterium]|nr:prepilin-type N-terminal cleavage/methylation domain-containing protein [Myxococcaceae bacterium]